MANNLKLFNTVSEYQSATLIKPSVSYVVENDKVYYDDNPIPPTPSFKWKATYQDSHVESAQCDSSSDISRNEINLTNLVSVEIGDCVTDISHAAFSSCGSLISVTIGSSISWFGDYAFINCTGLTSITINATTPPRLAVAPLANTNNCPIYVPSESVDTYKSASKWSDFASRIQPIPTE